MKHILLFISFFLVAMNAMAQEQYIGFHISRSDMDKSSKDLSIVGKEVYKKLNKGQYGFYGLMYVYSYERYNIFDDIGIVVENGKINFVRKVNNQPAEVIVADINDLYVSQIESLYYIVVSRRVEEKGWDREIYGMQGEVLFGLEQKPLLLNSINTLPGVSMVLFCNDKKILLDERYNPILEYDEIEGPPTYANNKLVTYKRNIDGKLYESLFDRSTKKVVIPFSTSEIEISMVRDLVFIDGNPANIQTTTFESINYALHLDGLSAKEFPLFITKNYYSTQRNGKYYIQEKIGKNFINVDGVAYDEILPISDFSFNQEIRQGDIIVKKDNKYYITLKGKIASEGFDEIRVFPFRRYIVESNKKYGFIWNAYEHDSLVYLVPKVYDSYEVMNEYNCYIGGVLQWYDNVLTINFNTPILTDVYLVDSNEAVMLTNKKVAYYQINETYTYGILYMEDGNSIVYQDCYKIAAVNGQTDSEIEAQLGSWYAMDTYGNSLVKYVAPDEFPQSSHSSFSSGSNTLSARWVDATEEYLSMYDYFAKAFDGYKYDNSNDNILDVRYWLTKLIDANTTIKNILGNSNDGSMSWEEQAQYLSMAEKKSEELRNFSENLGKSSVSVLEAIAIGLGRGGQ
jgi:hypothetical protein